MTSSLGEYYAVPSKQFLKSKSHVYYLTNADLTLRWYVHDPSCTSSLYQNNETAIKTFCRFRLIRQSLKPQITLLGGGAMLLLNVQNYTLDCSGRMKVMHYPRCEMCVRHLPCACSVGFTVSGSNTFRTFHYGRLGDCVRNSSSSDNGTKTVFNMALLQEFFSPEQLPDLKGDTLLDSALKVTLPKFKEFKHRFDQLTSDDTRISHDLSRYAAQIKNSSFVFHSLSEVLASQFDDILDERDVRISTLNIFNWEWWLNALPQACAILSLILGLYLF